MNPNHHKIGPSSDRLSANIALSVTQKTSILVCFTICEAALMAPSLFQSFRITLGIGFLAAAAFRLWCVSMVLPQKRRSVVTELETACQSLDVWPKYTVVLALYREAHMVPGLLKAIHALDYPQDLLEILVATEEDDHETKTACRTFRGRIPLQLVYGSGDAPKTKPRALNAALRVARGDLIVVYDAEDLPHPQQLREAAIRFSTTDMMLGVLQAPLRVRVDSSSTPLQHHFSMDYAALFEVILPALARVNWPFPLGGSSNHFRREALFRVGGWDPWNVTEDADIGFQLAKLGYRSEILKSPTFETSPSTLWPWIKQRSRWIKGHLQTLKVHTHRLNDLNPALGISLLVTLSFNLASAASTGPIICVLTAFALNAELHHQSPRFDPFDLAVLLAGWGTASLTMVIGIYRSGERLSLWHLAIAPLFWAAQCVAFARAVHQLHFRPYHWDKTHHVPADAAPSGAGPLDGSPGFGLSGGRDRTHPPNFALPQPPRDTAVE